MSLRGRERQTLCIRGFVRVPAACITFRVQGGCTRFETPPRIFEGRAHIFPRGAGKQGSRSKFRPLAERGGRNDGRSWPGNLVFKICTLLCIYFSALRGPSVEI